MKIVAFLALCGASAYATHGDADCHVFGAGDYGACGNQVSAADLSANCRYNGNSPPSKACVTAAKNVKADCGKCFKVTMNEKGAPKGTPGCGANGCPAYSRSILIFAIDSTGKADYEIAQNGWAGNNGLCPGVCAHTSYCSESAEDCQYGWLPDAGTMLSGCYSNSKDITHEEVPCPGGTSKPSSGTSKPSSGTSKPSGGTSKPSGGGTTPSGGSGGSFSCPSAGFFADPSDAHKFRQCVRAGGSGYVKSCGALCWDQAITNCNHCK